MKEGEKMRIIGAGTRDNFEYRELTTFWTVPNVITVLRFLLVPLFVWQTVTLHYGWATLTLVVLGSSDWIDGYAARKLDQISTVGKWLDPVADRVALIVIASTFVATKIAPAWLVFAIVIPDIILIINALVLFKGSPNLPVSNLGKIRTALLLAGTPLLLLGNTNWGSSTILGHISTWILALACLLHVIAAVGYFIQARRKAKALKMGTEWSG
ncbi:CDP-alcohol phosphatidyltransferase family protein [Paeniglutamicibacter sp. NPDC012692]|uniref:CDP-alcohol phosphatidyltransferase family protein n=1 Tax=Paeniglutamicibacter sp. NPDC012692 TaxID=3364388 RepID=UPI0036885C9E